MGEERLIVYERFKVIDEVRECRELFDKLEGILTASWDIMFGYAQKYYEERGNLDMLAKYITEDGLRLGAWISNLRSWESAGLHPKYLSAERRKMLEGLGMIWNKLNHVWERNFAAAEKFYKENGHLQVPAKYVSPDGIKLGNWISYLKNVRICLLSEQNTILLLKI